jgi:hypothetical protein
VPDTWPAPLPPADRAVLLVLSTSCGACDDVAKQLVDDPGHADWDRMGVVVSSAGREKGEDFVTRQGLTGFPVHIDPDGEWVASQFGVRTSPVALVFESGRLSAGHIFNDVTSLRMVLDSPSKDEIHFEATRHNGHKQKEAV